MFNLISKGSSSELFLNFINAKLNYQDYMFNHFINKNFASLYVKFSEFLSMQSDFPYRLNDNADELIDYYSNPVNLEFKKDLVMPDKLLIEKREPSVSLQNLLNTKKGFQLVQLDNVLDNGNTKLDHSNYSGSVLMSDATFVIDDNDYSFLSLSDKLNMVDRCYRFIGFPGIYSFFGCLCKKEQFIVGDAKSYPDLWRNNIVFFENEAALLEKLEDC